LQIAENQLIAMVFAYLWPFFRIAGFFLMAPVFSSQFINVRTRLLISVVVATVFFRPDQASLDLSVSVLNLVVICIGELLLGLAIAMVVQFIFDALIVAGQTLAMSMGLGFATMIDPQNGSSIPVVSQLFMLCCTLLFLSLDGHLQLLQLLHSSFVLLPIGQMSFFDLPLQRMLLVSATMFSAALKMALPAMVSILLVQLSFAVISRAAPSMNLFAVGFPMTILLGFVFLWLTFDQILWNFQQLLIQHMAEVQSWF